MSKTIAARKVAASARLAKEAIDKARVAKDEADRRLALADTERHAREAVLAAEEVERLHQFEIAEGERIAREENALGFWGKFKKSVGWQ